ncbi:elongation factor 1-beta [Candidatus Woesearchaeota archaeon]|nr:elongation factor 1-beta [Candidatus Woesearchaeota archaeon]
MAYVVVTLKIMPESPNTDLGNIETQARKKVIEFCKSDEIKSAQEPIAFGLKALKIMFVMDENKGSTEELEKSIMMLPEISSVETVDVRRAIG